jgi:hypothetical protein
MTRKFYIITTLIWGTHTAVSSKVITSPSADSGATSSQIDDIRNSGVQVLAHTTPGIWLRRASARTAAAYLTNAARRKTAVAYLTNATGNATGNAYSVKEVGEFKRTVRPIKGYKFERPNQSAASGYSDWWPENWRGDASKAAYTAMVGDLIPTRALARAALPEQQAGHVEYYGTDAGKLRIVTVYADA